MIVQILPFNVTISTFTCRNTSHFSDFLEPVIYKFCQYLFSFCINCQLFLLNFCWKKHLNLSFLQIFPLTFGPLWNSVFESYILQGRCSYFSTSSMYLQFLIIFSSTFSSISLRIYHEFASFKSCFEKHPYYKRIALLGSNNDSLF